MIYKHFRVNILLRVLFLAATVITGALLLYFQKYVSTSLAFALTLFQIFSLYRFVETTNRKLATFLDAIKYSDFAVNFEIDNHLGSTFSELNASLKNVLTAFRESRKENEENLQYLDTLVQNLSVGILSYNQLGEIEMLNPSACRLLAIPKLKFMKDLELENPEAFDAITALSSEENRLLRLSEDKFLSVQVTEMKLRNKFFRIVSIQNIRSELQKQELEAWQNLTRVLRHEIMNSIAPISSLIGTLNDILEEEIKKDDSPLDAPVASDIREALSTIKQRSSALKSFVEGYRSFTQIPEPVIKKVSVSQLFNHVIRLMDSERSQTEIHCEIYPENLQIKMDPDLIEMILINLVKNALEATRNQTNAIIVLKAISDSSTNKVIEVSDNGPGIIPEAREKIFIPFYTTKKGGSGIGLALSRQIMHLHHGTLTFESGPGSTVFQLKF